MNIRAKGMGVIVVGLLVIAPIVSYFYLNQGMTYRQIKLEELKVKGTIVPFRFQQDSSFAVENEEIEGQVVLLNVLNKEDQLEDLRKLMENFDDRKEFKMVTFIGQEEPPYTKVKESSNWLIIRPNKDLLNGFTSRMFGDYEGYVEGEMHILIDTAAQIRRIYPVDSSFSLRSVVEHIPIVLPRTPDSDLIYKGSNNEE